MKKRAIETSTLQTAGQRGPVDHERRAQIVEAADAHFRHYGYSKTAVADLAKATNLSTAYIYKFFESKQAIGEAICARCLGKISGEMRRISKEQRPAADRLRRMYKIAVKEAVRTFFQDRRLHDIVNIAREEHWQVAKDHQSAILDLVLQIITEGRTAGEFETETSLIKTAHAVVQTFELAAHPVLLEEHLDEMDERVSEISDLVLRGLRADPH